jgi:predicted DNA-binding transcriptional regulator AlpA
MNRDQIAQLPPLVDIPTAAEVLGIGRTLAYELVKTNRWPTTVLRMGKIIRIPTAALIRLLDDEPAR